MSPPQRLLFRCLLLLLPLLCFGLIEVCLRLGGYGYNPHLFKRLKIGAADYFVQNEDFSRRFFPPQLARHPGPVRFPMHKAPGTFRVFVLGESAAMGDPAQSFAPDRYLEMLLREKYPAIRFEIINVAFTAINSHVILPIARECAAHEGDLWIIYMGNNEMVGPFGAATVFGWRAPPLRCVRLVLEFQRFRVGQLLVEWERKLMGQGKQAASWGGMGMFLDQPVAPGSPAKEVVYRNFEQNLDEIVRAGIHSGAKVLLNTVAVNLKDCPPFASLSNNVLALPRRIEFDQLYTNALEAAAQNQWEKAIGFFELAGQLHPKSAGLQFHWGEALLAQTNLAGAREHLQLACDNDVLPFRADSRINAAILKERQKVAGGGLILFDATAALAGNGTGICGNDTFFEHVHFDFAGRYRLARAWAEQIEPLLSHNTNAWISQAVCEKLLGLSAWNRAQVLQFADERMQMPPLSSQHNNAQRRAGLAARINELRAQMNKDNATQTRQEFLKLIQQRPGDYFLQQEYAVFFELTGDVAAAGTAWQRFRDLVPQDSLGYYEVGRMLNAKQRYAEAEASLRIAVGIRPGRADEWTELGNALVAQKKYSEALACFSTAGQQDPRNTQILVRRGKVLAQMNRHAEAMESYRAAIRLDPAEGLSHHELGVELVMAGESDAAGKELQEAARLSPDVVIARFDYGSWLIEQKRWPEAQPEFEAVLRLEPGNLQAQQNLTWLKAKGSWQK